MATPIQLLIVDDDEQMRETLARRFTRNGMEVVQAGSGEEALAIETPFDIVLLDLHLPGMSGIEVLEKIKQAQPDIEVLMLTAHGSIESAILAMKKGAYDYLTKPFHLPELEIHIQKAFEKVKMARRERQWVHHLGFESSRYRLVGSSPPMKKLTQLIQKVAATQATILILGPSGTGKELVARAIHFNSERANRPLVTINCAALQETLLESELFGHEKGAFTSAHANKAGLVEVAEGGTLFIDEIAEMAGGLQAKLLRVLEDGHYRRLGSTQERHADVRILAATNKNLEDQIQAGKFREDLFYRLNVVTIQLVPLQDRRGDIPELVEHFLATRRVGALPSRITDDALKALTSYDWPGNVRELANVLERAQILAEEHLITLDDLPENIVDNQASAVVNGGADGNSDLLRDVERHHVRDILRREKGNKVQSARALGISRRALYRLIAKHKLSDC